MAPYSKPAVAALAALAFLGISALPASAAEENAVTETAAATELTEAQETAAGWITEDGNRYYLLEDGTRAVGEMEIGGVPYLFGYSGALKTDWQTVGGKRYYYDPEEGTAVFGWITYFGSEYYVTPEEGKLVGEQVIDGTAYDFSEDGVLLPTEEDTAPAPEALDSPAPAEEVTEAPAEEILPEAPAEELPTEVIPEETSEVLHGFTYADGVTRYYDNGTMVTGWLTLEEGSFYFGEDGVMYTGWLELDGKQYYFQDNGLMEENTTLEVEETVCTFASDGALKATFEGSKAALKVPDYKQKDTRWANVKLGSSTIGSVGCLVTSMAMMHSYHTETAVTPDIMKTHFTFTSGGAISSWNCITDMGYTVETYSSSVNASVMARIYSLLRDGKPVVLGSKGSGQHFVCITGYTGDGITFHTSDFTINDPGYSRRFTLADHLAQYGTLYKLIFKP